MRDDSGMGCLQQVWTLLVLLGTIFGTAVFLPPPEVTIPQDGAAATAAPPPAVEIVLSSDGDSVSTDDLRAADRVINRRLASMAQNRLISGSYQVISDAVTQKITVALSEGSMQLETILAALIAPGSLELVDFSSLSAAEVRGYEGRRIITSASAEQAGSASGEPVFPTVLTNADILMAEVMNDAAGNWSIGVELTPTGAARMGVFTQDHIGSTLAIVYDGVVISTPTIQARIETPILITGMFTQAEAEVLALQLNSATLPYRLVVESVRLNP